MSVFAHSVRAWVRGDWHEQGVATAERAAALFDRLRALDPGLNVQRLRNGRAVEIAGVSYSAPAPLAAANGEASPAIKN